MRWAKPLKALAAVALAALSAGGCWDARDINDRNIVTATIVDKTDYGYTLYVEIPEITGSSKQGGEAGQLNTSVVIGDGRTLSEARENLDREMDKPIFLGAAQSIIMTDRFASYSIEEYLLRLRQLNEYRKTVHMVVTTEDPKKLYNGKSENSPSIGFAIDSTIMSLVNSGELQHVSLMDILEKIGSPYPRYILPTIALVDNDPAFVGYSVFSGGMKTGFIPAVECNPITLVNSPNAKIEYVVPYKDSNGTVQVRLSRKEIKPRMEDGKINFDISLGFKALFLYPAEEKHVKNEDYAYIRSALQAMLEKEFAELLYKSQEEYRYDCFDLNEYFRIAYPEEFKRVNWADEYEKASFALSIGVELSPSELMDYNPGQ